MGLFDCTPLGFSMKCDVYYATDEQDDFGALTKKWEFDSSRVCQFYSVKDQGALKNFRFDDAKFYRLQQSLFGRTTNDIRIASDGKMIPLSHILITNIRSSDCDECVLYYETTGDYEGLPTVYTIKSVLPYISLSGKPDYWKTELDRADIQELNERVAC